MTKTSDHHGLQLLISYKINQLLANGNILSVLLINYDYLLFRLYLQMHLLHCLRSKIATIT